MVLSDIYKNIQRLSASKTAFSGIHIDAVQLAEGLLQLGSQVPAAALSLAM